MCENINATQFDSNCRIKPVKSIRFYMTCATQPKPIFPNNFMYHFYVRMINNRNENDSNK